MTSDGKGWAARRGDILALCRSGAVGRVGFRVLLARAFASFQKLCFHSGVREKMPLKPDFWRGAFGALGIATLGCGGAGGAAKAIRPDAPTGSAALGETTECRDVSRGSKPLVVDWKPEQRGDLEVAMSEGVA